MLIDEKEEFVVKCLVGVEWWRRWRLVVVMKRQWRFGSYEYLKAAGVVRRAAAHQQAWSLPKLASRRDQSVPAHSGLAHFSVRTSKLLSAPIGRAFSAKKCSLSDAFLCSWKAR
jgi:hypothetical protein